MARLYRQAPLNSIWEGSGNVNALDVLRAIGREPASLMALLKEASVARGRLTTLDTALDEVERDCAGLGALDGVLVTVPTFRSLLVQYDPLRTSAEALETAIRTKLDYRPDAAGSVRRWHLPACYDGDHAPDLADVAERTQHSTADVIRLHTETEFHVYVIGFVPGYGFLGDLPKQLYLPRRSDPRVRVPAGSIGIALNLTGVYPQESPGGWHLIGSCPVRFFDAQAKRPSLFAPGDKVRFERISLADHARLKEAVAKGDYAPPYDEVAA